MILSKHVLQESLPKWLLLLQHQYLGTQRGFNLALMWKLPVRLCRPTCSLFTGVYTEVVTTLPVRPGILVQRQSKEEMNKSLGSNIKAEEYKNRQTHEPANARDTGHEVTRSLSGVA